MYRIGVISDLHLDKRTEPGSWDTTEAAFRAAARADHVVVAGDTFDTATAMRRDRGAVERLLRGLGLWHPDRLTFVAGNHDIFAVGHRGDGGHRVLDALRTLGAKGQDSLEEFSEWIGELVPRKDRHFSNALFPYRRRLDGVTVVAADSTASTTLDSAQGAWSEEEDDGVRALFARTRGPRLLALHNPPEEASGTLSLADRLKGYVDGFPSEDFERLEALADDLRLDLVLAGHTHATSQWSWRLGSETRVQVMGRSGGLEGAPAIGMLEVGPRGVGRWRMVRIS
jgi:predicted phosphodiesterase